MSFVPEFHKGVDYYTFMEEISKKRDTKTYFEIGVNEGKLMSFVHAAKAVGIDPLYVLTENVAKNKQQTHLIAAPSDTFFKSPSLVSALGGHPDLCFLDGFHTFEFLLRDFYKTEALCSKRSLIIMHDCLPLDDIMTIRHVSDWHLKTLGTRWQGSWTGDVWKVIPILQRYRPDLRIVCVDCPPTGLICVTNLDPSSRVLEDNYFRIVDEFSLLDNIVSQIDKMYEGIKITPSSVILSELDNTLAFGW